MFLVILLISVAVVSWPCALVQCRRWCTAFGMAGWDDNPEEGTAWTTTAATNLWRLIMRGKISTHVSETGV